MCICRFRVKKLCCRQNETHGTPVCEPHETPSVFSRTTSKLPNRLSNLAFCRFKILLFDHPFLWRYKLVSRVEKLNLSRRKFLSSHGLFLKRFYEFIQKGSHFLFGIEQITLNFLSLISIHHGMDAINDISLE